MSFRYIFSLDRMNVDRAYLTKKHRDVLKLDMLLIKKTLVLQCTTSITRTNSSSEI